MAFTPCTPVTFSQTIIGFAAQIMKVGFLQGDGATPLDPSAWFNVHLASSTVINGIQQGIGSVALTPVFNGTTGLTTFTLTAANVASLLGSQQGAFGQLNCDIVGTPVTGDDKQVIAQGTLTLTQ